MENIAVIQTGGKQYVVSKDDVISIEQLPGIDTVGATVTFDNVLLTDDGKAVTIGTPTVSGAKVTGEVTEIGKARKITVLRYRAKSRYSKKKGHRQPLMKVKITNV